MADPDDIFRPPADPSRTPPADALPRRLLYATSARLGGTGLDATSLQDVLAAHRAGILGEAVGYADQQEEVPHGRIHSLRASPVRLLSCLPSQRYYAAKKWFVDRVAARRLGRGGFDAFHGWSGDCLRTLVTARQLDVPAVLDIPTWHRNKGRRKPFITKSEREIRALGGLRGFQARFRVSRQRILTEYELADLILVPSECSARTFLDVGIPPGKLAYVGRGVDVDRFRPADPPDQRFRVAFVGALIRRKGVHHLLHTWKRLALPDAELVLAGTVHPEIRADLDACAGASVRIVGFTAGVDEILRNCRIFAFPSECEGFAKATLEAAACALPLVATKESGDAVVDGVTGLVVPPNDPDALADALRHLHRHPDEAAAMGRAARQRVLDRFTWDHYRARLLHCHAHARSLVGRPPAGP